MRFQLETARLSLRPIEAADTDAFGALCNEPGVRRYLFDDEPVATTLVHEILARSQHDFDTRGFGLWLLQEKGADRIVGFCGLRNSHDLDDVEILYALSESAWHRGYALEAARAVLRHALDSVGLPCVIGIVDVPNQASWRILEKLEMAEFRPSQAKAHLRYAAIRSVTGEK